ncbi:MAG TPA: twin-arginine translocase TatA/TatE family subunit [Solirubrobacteraceae bacterium]|nr:twin-arginine translocase TatA/TatE family subunit [Solirubrobacteraceae bacterium]
MIGLENPLHLAIILVVVLMVFGAKRLPEMGKSLGTGLRGFKDAVSGNEHQPSFLAEHTETATILDREPETTPAQAA